MEVVDTVLSFTSELTFTLVSLSYTPYSTVTIALGMGFALINVLTCIKKWNMVKKDRRMVLSLTTSLAFLVLLTFGFPMIITELTTPAGEILLLWVAAVNLLNLICTDTWIAEVVRINKKK